MLAREQPSREDLRRELLRAAIDCFAKHGYAATSIDRIAKAAGVTKGALYYHFRDKEELLLEAVRNRIGQFEKRVAEELRSVPDAATALRALARICFDHATRSNHRRLIVTLMVEALDTHPALEKLFRHMMQRFRAFLANVVRNAQQRGEFREDVVPELAAELFAGAVMGAEIQFYQDPKHFDLARALDTYCEQFVQWLSANGASSPKATARKRRTNRGQLRTK